MFTRPCTPFCGLYLLLVSCREHAENGMVQSPSPVFTTVHGFTSGKGWVFASKYILTVTLMFVIPDYDARPLISTCIGCRVLQTGKTRKTVFETESRRTGILRSGNQSLQPMIVKLCLNRTETIPLVILHLIAQSVIETTWHRPSFTRFGSFAPARGQLSCFSFGTP